MGSDWKARAIVVLGTTVVGAWLFYWGLRVTRDGHVVTGTVILTVAVLVVVLGRRWLAPGRQHDKDGEEPPSRFPWLW